MKRVIGWERWLVAIGAVYMLLVPLFTEDSSDNASIWAAELAGVLLLATSLAALWVGADRSIELFETMIGALLFIAPWALDYSGLTGAAVSAWIVGAAVFAVSGGVFLWDYLAGRHTTTGHGLLHH